VNNHNQTQVSEADLDALEKRNLKRKAGREARQPRRSIDEARMQRVILQEEKAINLERVMQQEYEAWHLRTLGKSTYQIAQIMGVPHPQVTAWLGDALAQVRKLTQELIELNRELELSRTEMLLERYMPIALMENVIIERIRQGEPISVEDFDKPQRAAWIVMELIKMRCKIQGITTTQVDQALVPAVDIVSWLRTQKEFIQRTVESAPRDVLTLEVDNPIDEQDQNHHQNQVAGQKAKDQQNPEEFPGAL
jgi:hypothetical protein